MKLFIIVAAFLALANGLSTRQVWPAGKEFVYEYKARVVAGIPSIKQQLTGFGIKSIVKLQVVSPDTVLVKMTELETGKVNDDVPQAAPQVYRGSSPFHWSPIQGEAEEALKVPFKVNLRGGMVSSLQVAEDEPTWSVNIKKGLASQLNLNLQQTNRIPFRLRLGKKFEDKTYRHLPTPSAEGRFFAVEEDAMGGICKTVYTVVPLENYVAIREELDLPREILLEAASEPESSRPYMVTKVRDFDECERQPSWVHMNMKDVTEEPCNPALAMCHKYSTRTSISRYLIRKSPGGEYMRLERVWGESEFIVKPHGVKTERLWSVSNQTLVLLDERPISSRINVPSSKMTSTNLRYEFPVADPATIPDQRLNEDPAFQGLRLPHKQTIADTKEKTADREEEKSKSATSGFRSRSGKHGSKRYGSGKYGSGKYGSGKYGSKHSGLNEQELEREVEEEALAAQIGKYDSPSRSNKYGGKYGSKYGSKYNKNEDEEEEEGEMESSKYGSGYGLNKRLRRSVRQGKYGEGSSSESDESRSDYENQDDEEFSPSADYDNEYARRDSEPYYETKVMKSQWRRDLSSYYPSLKKACYYTSPSTSARIVRGANVKNQIQELIHEVVSEISHFEDLAEKESALKILQVARAISILSYDEIEEVYRRVVSSGSSPENVKTKKTLILDCMAMAGTHPAIMVIRDLVVKGEVKGETAAQVISTIPISVKVITPELIAELIEMVQSPQVKPANQPRGTNQVWITSLLAIGNMIHYGCVSPRTKNFNYPKEPRGAPLCKKNDPIIVNEFIPMLRHGLEQAHSEGKIWKKMVLLHALGNVGHPEVIPVLEACIVGQICRDPQVKTKAVNAMARVTRIAPSKVYKILRPVYANQKQHYAVRMAAFQTLIYCKPPPAFFTAVATDTWFEPSQQVGSFVSTTLANFANNTLPVYMNISRMARMASPLAKKFKLGAQYSRAIINSDYLPEETMGSFLHSTIFGSTKSLIPRFAYTRLINRAGGFNLDVLQAGIYAQGVQEVINKVLRVLDPVANKEEILSLWNRVSESWHSDEEPLGPIARDLNLKLRKDDPLNIMAWFKAFGGMERLVTLDYRTLLELVSDITPSFSSSGRVGLNMKVNYQKAFNPRSVTIILPTDVGVPVYFSKKSPVLISVRGHISLEADTPSLKERVLTESAELKIDLRPVVSQNVLIEMGVICPATKQAFIAGVNSHNLLSLPFKTVIKVNIPEKKLSFKLEPSSGPLPERITLAHAHQRPFTCIKRLDDFQPINKVPTIKYMQVVPQPHLNVTIVGEEVLGIPVEIISKVDRPFSPLTGLYKRILKQNPVTLLSFLNVPHSLRAYEHRIVVDSSNTETKRVVGEFSLRTSSSESPIHSFEPESSLESKSYKYRSEHYASTEQDLLGFLKNPSKYWRDAEDEEDEDVEELSYSPIIGSLPGVHSRFSSKRYSEDYENEEDVELHTKSEGKVYTLHGDIELQGPVPRIYRASILASKTPDSSIQKISAQFEKEGGRHNTPYKAFVSAVLQSPRLPRTPVRQALLQKDMTSLASVTVRFGRNTEHAIKAKVIMARTEKQRRIAQESQASKRCEADESKGLRYSSSCMRARQQATTLNKYVIDIQSENLPKSLLNVTYMLDNLVKYKLYPHLSVDPTARSRNAPSKLRVILNVDSAQRSHPYPVVDILTHKPHENAFFKTVKIAPIVEAFFPLNAKTPIVQKSLNYYLGWKYTPECRVGEESIQTFDNVTVHYPLPECYHVIAKDCSRTTGITVLAKQGPQGEKIVKIIKGSHQIVLVPTPSTSSSKPSVAVKINGSPLSPLAHNEAHVIKAAGQVVLKITKKTSGEIEVRAPARGIAVISDGLNIRVEASNMLRGRMCGLCGDFNGEKMAEFKGPRGCVHISPLTFGRSYAVPSEGCSSLPKISASQLLKHLEKSQYTAYETAAEAEMTSLANRHLQSCNPEEYEPLGESLSPSSFLSSLSSRRPVRRQRLGDDDQFENEDILGDEESSNFEDEELFEKFVELKKQGLAHPRSYSRYSRSGAPYWEPRSESARPCVRYITKVVTQGDKTCFSVKPVPECNLKCRPSKIINKLIGFHCKPSSEVSDSHLSNARFGVIEEFLNLESNMSSDLSIPDSCELLTV